MKIRAVKTKKGRWEVEAGDGSSLYVPPCCKRFGEKHIGEYGHLEWSWSQWSLFKTKREAMYWARRARIAVLEFDLEDPELDWPQYERSRVFVVAA